MYFVDRDSSDPCSQNASIEYPMKEQKPQMDRKKGRVKLILVTCGLLGSTGLLDAEVIKNPTHDLDIGYGACASK